MGKGFNDNDFMMFETMKKGGGCGGCLIAAISIIGSIAGVIALIVMFIF